MSKRRYKGVSVGSLGVILRFAGPMFEALNRMKKCFGLRVGVLGHPEVILGLAAHLAGAADEAFNVLTKVRQWAISGPSWGLWARRVSVQVPICIYLHYTCAPLCIYVRNIMWRLITKQSVCLVDPFMMLLLQIRS